MTTRFVLIEPALEGRGGHYFDYARRTLDAARAKGWETFLVTRRDVEIDGMEPHVVIRALTGEFWRNFIAVAGDVVPFPLEIVGWAGRIRDACGLGFPGRGSWRTLMRRLALVCFFPTTIFAVLLRRATVLPLQRRAKIFSMDLRRVSDALLGFGEDDLVFLPSIFVVEPAGLARFLAENPQSGCAQWRLLFRRDLDVEQRSSPAVLRRRRLRLAAVLNRLAQYRGVRFFTDTRRLTERYSTISEAAFSTAGIPVEVAPTPESPSRRPLNVVFLGGACVEKGFHHLPSVVERMPPDDCVRYLFQANYSTLEGEPECVAARALLQDHPGVQLLDGPLDTAAYSDLLAAADIVLLPYDPVAYRARSSGVFAEALAAGAPVVVTAGTWMADCIREIERTAEAEISVGLGAGQRQMFEHATGADGPSGTSIGLVAEASGASIAAALEQLVRNHERFSGAARAEAARWRRDHSASTLVSQLAALERPCKG